MANIYGEIPGVTEGTQFSSRKELLNAGVHRQLQAGIAGIGLEGAESIVLSGGYEDDFDDGNVIVYTGQGGRDANSGLQVANQELVRGNKGLYDNWITGTPVRVIRGHEHKSRFSPKEGYKYDGLYRVISSWNEKGKSGFFIFRYKLEKVSPDSPSDLPPSTTDLEDPPIPTRVTAQITRIIRDTKASRRVKEIYDYKCQACGFRIETSSKIYAEGAHIRPLGKPHNGYDVESNLLCLCPNHHAMFDFGVITVNDDFSINGLEPAQYLTVKHQIDQRHLEYHRQISITKVSK